MLSDILAEPAPEVVSQSEQEVLGSPRGCVRAGHASGEQDTGERRRAWCVVCVCEVREGYMVLGVLGV